MIEKACLVTMTAVNAFRVRSRARDGLQGCWYVSQHTWVMQKLHHQSHQKPEMMVAERKRQADALQSLDDR